MTGGIEIDILVDHPEAGTYPVEELADLARFAAANEPLGSKLRVLTVLLTGDERIRELHRDFMGLDSETDILTFPVDLEPGVDGIGGDVVISIDTARDNAAGAGHSALDEVRFLIVHGVLHLCGWDDVDDDDQARMLDRQSEIVAAFETLR